MNINNQYNTYGCVLYIVYASLRSVLLVYIRESDLFYPNDSSILDKVYINDEKVFL